MRREEGRGDDTPRLWPFLDASQRRLVDLLGHVEDCVFLMVWRGDDGF